MREAMPKFVVMGHGEKMYILEWFDDRYLQIAECEHDGNAEKIVNALLLAEAPPP